MTIMGINFTKMLVEKKKGAKGKINISNNVALTNAEKINLNFGSSDQQSLKFSFDFASKYEPEVGSIKLEGEVIYLVDKKTADKIVKEWEKNKRLEQPTMTNVLNNVLNKCNIEALILSKEMGLPAPIPLPKVNPPEETKKK